MLASSSGRATNNTVTGLEETLISLEGEVTVADVPVMSATPRHITIESSIPIPSVSFPAEDDFEQGSLSGPDTFSESESQSIVDKSPSIIEVSEGGETPKHRDKRHIDDSEDEEDLFINNRKARTKIFNNQKSVMKSKLNMLSKKTGCYGILYLRRYSSCRIA